MQKTWFITGASRGFGRIWADAALKRGDRVTATARKLADVADLEERFGDAVLPLALDVTNSDQVQQVVQQAYAHFGSLDVLVNNAGASLFGATEEATDEQILGLFDTNYLGMVRVLRAALPFLRQQGSGHILGVSSGLGITALPLIGFYCATKWAVEALHESLAHEVRAFGLKVTLVEPGAYATDFGKSSQIADVLEPYAGFRKQFLTQLAEVEQGDPEATAEAILTLVDAENPPLRLGLGTSILPRARAAYAERVATWEPSHSIATLLAMTGLRVGELLALRWQDIDFDKGFFSVKQTVYEGHFDVPKSKRSKRTLLLGPVCAQILTSLRKPGVSPATLVFSTRNGSPLSRRNLLNRQLKPACKALGLTGANWHWLRHAHATLLDSVGAPLGTVQALLGHASSEVTREIYIGSVPENARVAVQNVEKLIGPKWTQVPDWPETRSTVIN